MLSLTLVPFQTMLAQSRAVLLSRMHRPKYIRVETAPSILALLNQTNTSTRI